MSRPVVLALPDARACAEMVTDALVEADLTPTLLVLGEMADDPTVDADRVAVLMVSRGVSEDNPLAERFRAVAEQACADDRAIAVLTRDVDSFNLPCTQYRLKQTKPPEGLLKPLMPSTLALQDIVAAAKYKASGRDPPPPSAPRKLAMRYMAAFSSAVILPIVALLSFTDVLIGLSSAMGIDEQASAEAETAYAAIPVGNCQALRTFVGSFEESHLTEKARDRLDLLEERESTVNETDTIILPILSLPGSDEAFASREGATNAALTRAKGEGEQRCGEVAQAASGTLESLSLDETSSTCDQFAAGFACRTSANAICEVQIARTETVEWCP